MKAAQALTSEKGMATLETLPLLFIFLFLFSYMLGSFGVIHTAIKHSISARAYAFETFRNRSSLVYFRDIPQSDRRQFKTNGNRFHGILSEARDENDNEFRATERPIRMGIEVGAGPSRNDLDIHNNKVHTADELQDRKRNRQVEVSPVWIMIQYGICLDVRCGG